jgi:hypothetical protein
MVVFSRTETPMADAADGTGPPLTDRRARRQARNDRISGLRPTRADVRWQLGKLSIDLASWSVAALVWWSIGGLFAWVAIPFLLMALWSAVPLVVILVSLARGRHPVQSSDRLVCDECAKVRMPWAMETHLRGSGHHGSHPRVEPVA